MIRHIDFDAARVILEKASAIRMSGLFYVLRPMESHDIIELSLVTDENPMRVEFHRADHSSIPLHSSRMLLREHHGEDAQLELSHPWELSGPAVTVFQTAETAAALMDAIHGNVTQQREGATAYEELYEAATKLGFGFPGIWCWMATLAEAARDRMEAMWATGEAEFIDCVHMAAQLFHNFITDPTVCVGDEDPLTREKAQAIWEVTLIELREHEVKMTAWRAEQEQKRMVAELEAATRNDAGHPIGCFRRVSEKLIEYTNYGGAPMKIHRLDNGLWRVNDDKGTDSPRPVGAFKIASIPINRE